MSKFSSAGEEATATSWDELIDEIITIWFLPDDWDGEGSVAPDPGLVAGASKLALALKANKTPPADRVLASVNGTVYFEWHTPLGYQEIEVTSPVDAESRWVPQGSEAAEIVGIAIR